MNNIIGKAGIDTVAFSQDGKFVLTIDVDDIYMKRCAFQETHNTAEPDAIYLVLPQSCSLFGIPIVWRTEGT